MCPRYTIEAFGTLGSLFCCINSREGPKDIRPALRKKRKWDTDSLPTPLARSLARSPPCVPPSLPAPCEHLLWSDTLPGTRTHTYLHPSGCSRSVEGRNSRQISIALRGNYKDGGKSGHVRTQRTAPRKSWEAGKATEDRWSLHRAQKQDSGLSRENPGAAVHRTGVARRKMRLSTWDSWRETTCWGTTCWGGSDAIGPGQAEGQAQAHSFMEGTPLLGRCGDTADILGGCRGRGREGLLWRLRCSPPVIRKGVRRLHRPHQRLGNIVELRARPERV